MRAFVGICNPECLRGIDAILYLAFTPVQIELHFAIAVDAVLIKAALKNTHSYKHGGKKERCENHMGLQCALCSRSSSYCMSRDITAPLPNVIPCNDTH